MIPLGKQLSLDMDFRGHLVEFEVVGVAKDVRSANVSRIDPAYVFLPTRSHTIYNVLVRSDLDTVRVAAAVRAAVEATDRRLLPGVHVAKLDDGPFLRTQKAIPGIVAPFLAAIACVALVLAGLGIYGVTLYVAIQRTREVGIRMALGASAAGVQRLIVWQAMTSVLLGAGCGVAAAAALSRVLQETLKAPSTPDFLFGVGAFDPATFGGVTAFAIAIAALARGHSRAARDPRRSARAVAIRNSLIANSIAAAYRIHLHRAQNRTHTGDCRNREKQQWHDHEGQSIVRGHAIKKGRHRAREHCRGGNPTIIRAAAIARP